MNCRCGLLRSRVLLFLLGSSIVLLILAFFSTYTQYHRGNDHQLSYSDERPFEFTDESGNPMKHQYMNRGEKFEDIPASMGLKDAKVLIWMTPLVVGIPTGGALYAFSVAQMFSLSVSHIDLFLNVPPSSVYVKEGIEPLKTESVIDIIHWTTSPYGINFTSDPGMNEFATGLFDKVEYDFVVCRGECRVFTEGNLEFVSQKTVFIVPDNKLAIPYLYVSPAHALKVGGYVAFMDWLSEDRWKKMNPKLDKTRVSSIPPMLSFTPNKFPRKGLRSSEDIRVCYMGQVDESYLIRETIEGLQLANNISKGKKFSYILYDTKTSQGYAIDRSLVVCRGRVSHLKSLNAMIHDCDFGIRGYSQEFNLISTKVIEMGALGLPVLMNPQRINKYMFGDDYPLFFDPSAEHAAKSFANALVDTISRESSYRLSSERVVSAAQKCTISYVFKSFMPPFMKWLYESRIMRAEG